MGPLKQRFGRGGFKRPKTTQTRNGSGKIQKPRNNRPVVDETAGSSSPSTSGDSYEERSIVESEEEAEAVVTKEPSMYDNLLKTLGSGSQFLAKAYKKRQREEEGESDTEEDVDSGSESISLSEEDDDDTEGTDSEPPVSPSMRRGLQGSSLVGILEQDEVAGTDNDDEVSDMDEENDMRANDQSTIETTSTSSFNDHLGYDLSKGEVDNLSKKKWSYKWEVPAVDMSNCKWIGTRECFMKEVDMNSGYCVMPKLYKHWLDIYNASRGKDFHSSKQRSFFSLCNSYMDILHHNKKPFYLKGMEEDSSTMDAYIMHSLNHIFRTRDLVTKNDKVAKHQVGAKEEILNNNSFLDRGFTRPKRRRKMIEPKRKDKRERPSRRRGKPTRSPKVLLLLPLASIALRVVKRLIQLTPAKYKVNVERIDRFSEEFGTGVEHNEDRNEASEVFHDHENSKVSKSSKPSDFQALFGGNNNDHFMIGIKFTRRSIKLYSDFYSSDMIVASPLGLITKIGEAEVEKEKNVDYLSSIEVLIIDHADVIAMQNWAHVSSVVEQLNRLPSKPHGTDIMRIRPWYSEGHAQFYRQTIVLSSYLNPDINALFNHHCVNYQGKVKLVCEHKGVLPKVLLQVQQIYERFNAESIVDADDARLEYFSKKVFPKIKDSVQGGTMIFISSYFEFVRVRNFLKSQDASFCLLGEYTKQSDISRARIWFFQGKRNTMLYTERAHFYHRYKIRGIQNLIIYSLPERKEFYPEIVNMLEGSSGMTCTVLYSRFDQLRLERIVGTAPAKSMLKSEKGLFVFR